MSCFRIRQICTEFAATRASEARQPRATPQIAPASAGHRDG